MAKYFDRYKDFRSNGSIKPLPGLTIPTQDTDKYITYKRGETRLDKVSDDYYNNPYSGWLILQANPDAGGLEFSIPTGKRLRVPYPFENAIERYLEAIRIHKTLYGE